MAENELKSRQTIDPLFTNPLPPLLKWPGGKRSLVKEFASFIPESFNRYVEPFVGGAALFFALGPKSATLSDSNVDLVETYSEIRDNPEAVIRALCRMNNSELDYYRIRASKPKAPANKAARFIYLCTLAFNGIHRYNRRGEFNVPYGFKRHLKVCDQERIRACSARLKKARLIACDFEETLDQAREGDFVYLDPPYTVLHNNNGFVKYNASIFSWRDQERLARAADAAQQRGCHVIISNADHESVRALYTNFQCKNIIRHSIIASSSAFRRQITECIFLSRNQRA